MDHDQVTEDQPKTVDPFAKPTPKPTAPSSPASPMSDHVAPSGTPGPRTTNGRPPTPAALLAAVGHYTDPPSGVPPNRSGQPSLPATADGESEGSITGTSRVDPKRLGGSTDIDAERLFPLGKGSRFSGGPFLSSSAADDSSAFGIKGKYRLPDDYTLSSRLGFATNGGKPGYRLGAGLELPLGGKDRSLESTADYTGIPGGKSQLAFGQNLNLGRNSFQFGETYNLDSSGKGTPGIPASLSAEYRRRSDDHQSYGLKAGYDLNTKAWELGATYTWNF